MPLSTIATVTPWPLVRSHTPLKPRARWAHGSPVRCARPRCDRQPGDGSGMPLTGAGGPEAARCGGGAGGGAVGGLADRDGFGAGVGAPVAVGCTVAAGSPPPGRDGSAEAPGGPAASVRGTRAAIVRPAASAAP